jgi:hypothetical protein
MGRKENIMNDKFNPSHYIGIDGLEAIKVIDAFELDFYKGSAVSYILRAGRKAGEPEIDDLRKAHWMLEQKILKLTVHMGDKFQAKMVYPVKGDAIRDINIKTFTLICPNCKVEGDVKRIDKNENVPTPYYFCRACNYSWLSE